MSVRLVQHCHGGVFELLFEDGRLAWLGPDSSPCAAVRNVETGLVTILLSAELRELVSVAVLDGTEVQVPRYRDLPLLGYRRAP